MDMYRDCRRSPRRSTQRSPRRPRSAAHGAARDADAALMAPMMSVAKEIARALVGLLVLPRLLMHVPSDEVVASMATGGEWLRLNGSAVACFAASAQYDSRCRYLERAHCDGAGCVWADPTQPRCHGAEQCEAITSRGRCDGLEGCEWARPLDVRIKCRGLPSGAYHGWRCDGVVANRPGALDAIRDEMRAQLTTVVAFGLANLWLVRWFGSVEQLAAEGKPYVLGVFACVAAGSSVRLQYLRD